MLSLNHLRHLDNHFTAANNGLNNKQKRVNLLEKYKNMSNLDAMYLHQYVNYEINTELTLKYENIMRENKHVFEHETFEEDDRDTKRTKVNRKLLKYIEEARKILPMKEVLNDTAKTFSFIAPLYIFDESMATKFTVNT